jgi:hypothetical protein
MPPRLIWAGLIAGLGLQLAGCNGSPTFIAAGTVEATASVQTAAVVVGGHSQTVSVTFVAAAGGGTPISDLVVGGLSSLPAGWHGPTSFSCGTVTTGSGCVLNLTYAPTVGGSGTLEPAIRLRPDELRNLERRRDVLRAAAARVSLTRLLSPS